MIIKKVNCFIKEYVVVLKEKWFNKKNINYNENKYYSYYNMMCEWIVILKRGKNLTEYLLKNNYKKVAVYGFGKIGVLVVDELLANDMDVGFIIDKNVTDKYRGIEVINISELPENPIDAIIITTTYEYLAVAEELCDYTSVKLISLEDIIHSIYRSGIYK